MGIPTYLSEIHLLDQLRHFLIKQFSVVDFVSIRILLKDSFFRYFGYVVDLGDLGGLGVAFVIIFFYLLTQTLGRGGEGAVIHLER